MGETWNPSRTKGYRFLSWPALYRVLLSLLILSLLFFLVIRWYRHSRLAASQVESHLSNVLASDVRIDGVEIGLQDCSLIHGLCVDTEARPGYPQQPLLQVSQTRADLSVLDWLVGRQEPAQVDLHQARIQLQFNRQGSLLNKMPKPGGKGKLPRCFFHDSSIRIDQEGNSTPLELVGLDAELQQQEADILLTGTIRDPNHGDWKVSGWIKPEIRAARLQLKTEGTQVDRHQLESLPFVSSNVWRQVVIGKANTTVDITVDFSLDRPGVRSLILLKPEVKGLRICLIHLEVEKATGEVIIQDGLVTLNDLEGNTAGGIIKTNAILDFRRPLSDLTFTVGVDSLDLTQLPLAWQLPPHAVGHVTGRAQIDVRLNEDQVVLNGNGRGLVQHPLLGGVPLPIRLTTEENHLRFGLPLPIQRAAGRLKGLIQGRKPQQ